MSLMSNAVSDVLPLNPLRGLVPMAHVMDVARSIEFYRQLGFEVGNKLEVNGRMQWAWIKSGDAHLMVTRSARPMNADAQDVHAALVSAKRTMHASACQGACGCAWR